MKMKILILLVLLLALGEIHTYDSTVNTKLDEDWEIYKNVFAKKYNKDEYSRRLIWEENLRYIQIHNYQYYLGRKKYFLDINQFADMTIEEFILKYLLLKETKKENNGINFMIPLNFNKLPYYVNWVTKGYVTPVKSQGNCGSCWTFSTTGSIEGQYFRKTKKLTNFSEQQILDCSRAFNTSGCNGGWMNDAFNYVNLFGIECEKDYVYTAKEDICKYNASKVITKISGHINIKTNDEVNLAIAVATQGPVSVAIDASHKGFHLYKGGIYDEPNCTSTNLDHAVLVVGYGSDNGTNYWLVKNSWDVTWGNKGYIKMSKDKNNQCGIASKASYPII